MRFLGIPVVLDESLPVDTVRIISWLCPDCETWPCVCREDVSPLKLTDSPTATLQGPQIEETEMP